LYIVNEQELRIIKGDKFPVGSFFDEEINLFTTINVEYQKGDLFYMFTDGYPDQFG
jgi:serine phosphatase RsbU (regulator of sigma subunit)